MKEMLREYQREMLSRLEKAWEKNRSVMVQMPTGTGKTWLMAEAIRNAQLGLCSLANEGTQGADSLFFPQDGKSGETVAPIQGQIHRNRVCFPF